MFEIAEQLRNEPKQSIRMEEEMFGKVEILFQAYRHKINISFLKNTHLEKIYKNEQKGQNED